MGGAQPGVAAGAALMELGLTDQVAIVGGASRGIGRAIAAGLAAEGAHVLLTGRDAGALAAAADALAADHAADRIRTLAGDLAADGHAAAVVADALAAWGRVDHIVANVGSGAGDASPTPGRAEWERLLDANLWPAVALAEAALPHLTATGGGSIVLITSITGLEDAGGPLPYGAAKAALVRYAGQLARLTGPSGVRVNAVAPGNVRYPGNPWDRRAAEDPARWERQIRADVALGRFGTPEDIAAPVVFLCSARAAFVTGTCLVVDGGQTRGTG
jgi:3-oxoacyl-[acyl-carrier protein] reductase